MQNETRSTNTLLHLVYFTYFFCGMTQCFESVFLPEMKEYFHLSYQQQMYVMFAKNIAFLLAILVGARVLQVGYKNCLTIAMALYAVGTLLLVPGLRMAQYNLVLLAFVVIGSGFTIQMVAGSPLISALGLPQDSSSRLNFGNALGAIAQIIAPASLTIIIPATALSAQAKLPYMQAIFITFGLGLVLLTLVTLMVNNVDIRESLRESSSSARFSATSVWHPKVVLGLVAIFLVLGTEACLFGFFRNYLEDTSIAGLSAHQSERLFTVYFAVFALGRMMAAWIQKHLRPAVHIAFHLVFAMFCLLLAMFAKGTIAVVAVVAIGFFASIFFPTLYAMAIENMGDLTGQASGVLTLGFLGCAIIPVLQGKLADSIGLQLSYGLGLIGYLFALFYVFRSWRSENADKADLERTAIDAAGNP
ncbi:MAG: MFS transporter [Terriglobales bacterium]|jgi:FHS family L-fucose permease-like MFS transporter